MQAGGATRLRLSRLPLVLHFTSSKLLDVGPDFLHPSAAD
jgi:hypothetical protein